MPPPASPALVLYAPSLNETAGSGAIDGAAQRLARTLDHLSQPVGTTYAVREAAPEKFGSDGVAEVREILRVEPGQSPDDAVLTHRLYHLNYHPALDDASAPNVFVEAGRLVVLWFVMMLRFVRAVFLADALSKMQKTAIVVAGFGLLLITAYVLLVLGAVAHVVLDLVESGVAGDDFARADGGLLGGLERFDRILDLAFGNAWAKAIAIIGGFSLTFGTIRQHLQNTVRTYLRFGRYMESPTVRATCTGRFNELLEHLLGRSAARIDVVAYSLGSLVTLDALFPADGQPTPRAAKIVTLTTVGCPFDLVRTFWPAYFAGREVSAPDLQWFNVYSPVDLLGSNFTNDDGLVEKPTHGINAAAPAGAAPNPARASLPSIAPALNLFYDPMGRRELSFFDAVFFGAYRAHAQYWVPGQPAAESCYKRFVPLVYRAA